VTSVAQSGQKSKLAQLFAIDVLAKDTTGKKKKNLYNSDHQCVA